MHIGVVGPFNPYAIKEYLFSIDCIPDINITATSVNLYVKGLLDLGYKVTVFTICSSIKQTKVFEGLNIKVYAISNKYKIRGLRRVRVTKRIADSVNKEIDNIDVLHAEWTYEYAFSIRKFRKKTPIYCSVRDWCPYLLTLVKGFENKLYWLTSKYFFKKVMKTKEFIFIANSGYTKKQIIDNYSNRRVFIIPNPINSEKILLNRITYPSNDVFVSISQNLNNPRKNYYLLLKAFNKYINNNPSAHLNLIGNYSKEWFDLVSGENLLTNVTLLGEIGNEEVYKVLDESSILVHPSLEETFGNILLEAMCRRCLCIGGISSGAVPEVLNFGECGILCDVTDENDLISAMTKATDKSVFTTIVNNATNNILKKYDYKKISQWHIELFKKTII